MSAMLDLPIDDGAAFEMARLPVGGRGPGSSAVLISSSPSRSRRDPLYRADILIVPPLLSIAVISITVLLNRFLFAALSRV